jgi:hypothetical protein
MTGRYDYIPADSSAGVIFYDDKFAYSHHATDPASGRLLNALTLFVFISLVNLDDRASESTPPSKLPSFINMCEFAIKDDEVKAQFAKERMEQATVDFTEDNGRQPLNWISKERLRIPWIILFSSSVTIKNLNPLLLISTVMESMQETDCLGNK